VIHATIFKQEEPQGDDQSIYYVFERINTGGTRLSGQEIRTCIYHGPFAGLLRDINNEPIWRQVYGPVSRRMKDQELILRFYSFYFQRDSYSRPMTKFLNSCMDEWRRIDEKKATELRNLFVTTIEAANTGLGDRPFRPERALNAAVFDSVMVGLATRLAKGPITSNEDLAAAYKELLAEPSYASAYRRATADEESVKTRMKRAIEAFSEVS
jgi:hypothetical protein